MSNPYETTDEAIADTPIYPLVSARALLLVFCMTVVGAVLGAAGGTLVASVAPGYYRTIAGGTGVSPTQIGLGLGITQGAGAGFIGSIALIAITYHLRYKRQFPNPRTS